MSGGDTRLVGNGTVLDDADLAPAIGMNWSGLLADRAKRRQYGLPTMPRAPKLEDRSARARPSAGGWIRADITVSTAVDQTPLAPGRRVSDVTRDGRRTARFMSGSPLIGSYSVRSARYAEKHLRHAGVDLAVHYHPAHAWNVDRMLATSRASLDYYGRNFGPYPFGQYRIAEAPIHAPIHTASALAAVMPYSEDGAFVADDEDPDRIDYVAYVTAHEFAHGYRGYQIQGADMQGATMLTETLAQDSVLMVMKQLYGPDRMRPFLRAELKLYLRGRDDEATGEPPLARVEDQRYIRRPGHVPACRPSGRGRGQSRARPVPRPLQVQARALSALDRSDPRAPGGSGIARRPGADHRSDGADHDLRPQSRGTHRRAAARRRMGRHRAGRGAKFHADDKGVDRETPLSDRIAIGLFTAEPGRGSFGSENVVLWRRVPIRSGRRVLRFVTAARPAYAGVDPYNFYIDRNSGDNVAPVRD